MPRWFQGILAVCIVALVGVMPVVYHRVQYAHSKRLREVVPGLLYRSGQMTVDGFKDALIDLDIKTVVNLQDAFPDPDLVESYFDRSTRPESKLCRELGVNYVFIAPDLLRRDKSFDKRPAAVEQMLALFDDPKNYPMLIHCKAGLHRTGCMTAIYRMEYQGWSPEQAVEEMKDHGFGDTACTAANDYVYQYVLTYQRGSRKEAPQPVTRSSSRVEDRPR